MSRSQTLKNIYAQISETPEQYDSQTDVRRATTVNARLAQHLANEYRKPRDIYELWQCTQALTQTLIHIGEQLKCEHTTGGVVIEKCKSDLGKSLMTLKKAQSLYTQSVLDQAKDYKAYKDYAKTVRLFKGNKLNTLAFHDPEGTHLYSIYVVGTYLNVSVNPSLKSLPRACFGFHSLDKEKAEYSASTMLKFPAQTLIPVQLYKV